MNRNTEYKTTTLQFENKMFTLVIEHWYFHVKACFKKSWYVTKTFSSVYVSVYSLEQDIIVFNIPVIIAKKNQNAQGLKTLTVSLKVSEYDQEIPQSQTADNHMSPQGRATQPSRDTRKTN